MLIKDLYTRRIDRNINGVVKADQLDPESVWQELDEFVITREMDGHFHRFFSVYNDALQHPNQASAINNMGVWVSGFFGSGKSHFLKILSYLLENKEHSYGGQSKRAIDFFREKVEDSMLLGDMERAVATPTEVILFNVDSKADHSNSKTSLIQVFFKVLHERQGYSPDYPHIAAIEQRLDRESRLEAFHDAYARATGGNWLEERDAYQFNLDEIAQALSEVLGQSLESAKMLLDNSERDFQMTIENLAESTLKWLNSKSTDHRVIFLVDEIGQFIGQNTGLMLNLQTIVENLGVKCGGRAWVVVTSQEDLDAVLGKVASAEYDFSKITGRFKTRLSLSSANVDEVIQQRLLAKTPEAANKLRNLYNAKEDIIKNQFAFGEIKTTFKSVRDGEDFADNYPFAPYQFTLLQKIFESIRRTGATGLHLAQGERSLLDAFQAALRTVEEQGLDRLIPLYSFYPPIEEFLEGAITRTFTNAAKNTSLQPFDVDLLKTLFLIRYVEEMPGSVDNLITLCTDAIDADRLALRQKIEESLARLEKQTLIHRNDNLYQFLSNEEQAVNREIKNTAVSTQEEIELLSELFFDELLKGANKHRFSSNQKDFSFNRRMDGHPRGTLRANDLFLSVISPLNADYALYTDGRATLDSSNEGGQVLFRLPDNQDFFRELHIYRQIDKYIGSRIHSDEGESIRVIFNNLRNENSARRNRLISLLKESFAEASCFIAGSAFTVSKSEAREILFDSLEYLIKNIFTKNNYIVHLCPDTDREIREVLNRTDIIQGGLNLDLPENNPEAVKELQEHIKLASQTHAPIVLQELIEIRFGQRPYGWPAGEVALLLARLFVQGEIQFHSGSTLLSSQEVATVLTQKSRWSSVKIEVRRMASTEDLESARKIVKSFFGEMPADTEEALEQQIRQLIQKRLAQLHLWKGLADTGRYPGLEAIKEGLGLLDNLAACRDSTQLIERIREQKEDLDAYKQHFDDLEHFYTYQRPSWERLRAHFNNFKVNTLQLEADDAVKKALEEMNRILNLPAPYKHLSQVDSLIATVSTANDALIKTHRDSALSHITKCIDTLEREMARVPDSAMLAAEKLSDLKELPAQVQEEKSIAHLHQLSEHADTLLDLALHLMESIAESPPEDGGVKETPPAIKPRQVIDAASLLQGNYLETEEEVRKYLQILEEKMLNAIHQGKRIELR